MHDGELDTLCVNTLRFLAVDMVQKANSGHPGLPLGAAPMAYVLWTRFLRHNPKNPDWWDRDRFVLSAGHGSALYYALLHLTGYALPLEQIKRFRQFDSLTPGHPERHVTPGVEASTGPLGQGIGNAVGMAIADAHLAAHFSRPGHALFGHHTYVLASDGDMMEGVESEAASLAGQLGLGRLIVLYDNNHVTLSGETRVAFREDVAARHRAYGWHVQHVKDGTSLADIGDAIEVARGETRRPSLILIDTVIGYGAPKKQGSYEAHGSPLGEEEVRATKEALGFPAEPAFLIPPEALRVFRAALVLGDERERAWQEKRAAYARDYPALERELARRFLGELPQDFAQELPVFPADAKGMATRKASESVMQALSKALPEFVGGSGDLDPSTFTWLKQAGDFEAPDAGLEGAEGLVGGGLGYGGRNVHFGVREHAMGAAVNGMAYHGGVLPFSATFLVFSDYMRAPIRLAAIAKLRAVFVFTHDSIAVGEDGPTHQPVEQLAALRAIPNLLVVRPADANETRVAWQVAVEQKDRPSALVFTRQNVPTLDRTSYADASQLRRGGYVLNPELSERPDVILMASGSEVGLIASAAPLLEQKGLKVRLVSMPCFRLFEEQPQDYREQVLPRDVRARLSVEAASSFGWDRFTGPDGVILGVDKYGASAPGLTVMHEYGITVERVVEQASRLAQKS